MIVVNEQEKQALISMVQEVLSHKDINKPVHIGIKEGYRAARFVLCNNVEDLEQVFKQSSNLQARSIGWLAVDYLHGEITADNLMQFAEAALQVKSNE